MRPKNRSRHLLAACFLHSFSGVCTRLIEVYLVSATVLRIALPVDAELVKLPQELQPRVGDSPVGEALRDYVAEVFDPVWQLGPGVVGQIEGRTWKLCEHEGQRIAEECGPNPSVLPELHPFLISQQRVGNALPRLQLVVDSDERPRIINEHKPQRPHVDEADAQCRTAPAAHMIHPLMTYCLWPPLKSLISGSWLRAAEAVMDSVRIRARPQPGGP
eukprot:6791033-Prymnesium_polylepis.2